MKYLLIGATAVALGVAAANARAQDAIVPDDFASIQAAVIQASDGNGDGRIDIFVRAGTYNEDVFIRRNSLTLTGENPATTVIQGSGTRDTVQINRSNDVTISGFTVISGGVFDSIEVNRVNLGRVEDNVVTGGGSGVKVDRSANVIVADNEAFGTSQEAINLDRCQRVTVLSNFVHDNLQEGITVDACQRVRVQANQVTDNGGNGIRDRDSSNDIYIQNQSLRNLDEGFRLENTNGNILFRNTSSLNLENGLRMKDTQNSLITENAFTSNVNYGVRRENWLNDDFDRSLAGIQNPPGDNDLSGNGQGELRED